MFPTPWTITVHEHSYGDRNAHGERADLYEDRDELVYGWAPVSTGTPSGAEPYNQGRRSVVADLDVFGPPSLSVKSLDEVTIPVGPVAGRYTVEGDVEDFNHGPFNWSPGVRVALRRVRDEG